MIAKAILFKAVQKLARDLFTAFQANVVAYTISMMAVRYGNVFDLGRVWDRQSASPQLMEQIAIWAREVNDVLHGTADGRMVSEWAKKAECKQTVLGRRFSDPDPGIPELRLVR